jgi:aspartokinase
MPQTRKNKIKHAWIIQNIHALSIYVLSNKKTTLTSFLIIIIIIKNNNKRIGEFTVHQDTCLYSLIGAAVHLHFASRSSYLAWLLSHLFG